MIENMDSPNHPLPMVSKRTAQIKGILEKLYARYNHRRFVNSDPLQFVYRYYHRADMEIVAFLSAQLAYGKVGQIQKNLADLFTRMGKSPYTFVRNFADSDRKKLRGFKHRFTSGDDIADLLELLRDILSKFDSIENFFVQGSNPDHKRVPALRGPNIIPALSKFCYSLLEMHANAHNGHIPRGLSFLLPRPTSGSACKRLNLFLRWMVRNDEVDVGLWKSIDKAKLVVPVDVHIARLCRILGFHSQKTISLSTAIDITKNFAEIEPSDPVKYDFALSRVGIMDGCTGQIHYEGWTAARREPSRQALARCNRCGLFEYCAR